MIRGHRNKLALVMGALWIAFSSIFVGLGLWAMWTGFSGGSAEQIWIGLAFTVFGGFFVALGLAMIRDEPLRITPKISRQTTNRNGGLPEGASPVVFILLFGTAGLAMLVLALLKRDFWWWGMIPALPCLAFGIGGMWVVLKRRRRRQKRALKAAREVARSQGETPPRKALLIFQPQAPAIGNFRPAFRSIS
ncbi:hypothetical protein [Luteolibacter sp. Populi]|uniref:hypothetical protein n=1 Tax=Luteolibacter sp. Populi TaxID=3230487 RepID=UPI003465C193